MTPKTTDREGTKNVDTAHPVVSTRYDLAVLRWAVRKSGARSRSHLLRCALDKYIGDLIATDKAA